MIMSKDKDVSKVQILKSRIYYIYQLVLYKLLKGCKL